MTNEERLSLFESYTNIPTFEYDSNGPDKWVCPVCKYSSLVTYVRPGEIEDIPDINEINHAPDCPQNPENK